MLCFPAKVVCLDAPTPCLSPSWVSVFRRLCQFLYVPQNWDPSLAVPPPHSVCPFGYVERVWVGGGGLCLSSHKSPSSHRSPESGREHVMVRVLGRTGDLFGGWGAALLWRLGQGLGWAGAGRGMKGGLTWASSRGSSLRCLALALTPCCSKAAGARLRLRPLLLFMGPGMWGEGGRSTVAPCTPVGREKGGRATAWEGAMEPGEEGGLRVAQRQDPRRHSDTSSSPATPTPSITERRTLRWCMHTHTHSRREAMETYAPTTNRWLTHSLDTNRCQHINHHDIMTVFQPWGCTQGDTPTSCRPPYHIC